MITLDVHPYCHDCDGFEPVFHNEKVIGYSDKGDMLVSCDGAVRCRYHKRCASIEKFLNKKLCQS